MFFTKNKKQNKTHTQEGKEKNDTYYQYCACMFAIHFAKLTQQLGGIHATSFIDKLRRTCQFFTKLRK